MNLFFSPLIIIAILLFLSYRLYKILLKGSESLKNKKEFQGNIVALVIGVLLGFAADIAKDEIKESYRQYKVQKLYYFLLKKQACDTDKTFSIFKKYLEKHKEEVDKNTLPFQVDLEYWNYIKDSPDFINTIFEKPFDKISQKMFALEQLNQLVVAAKTGDAFAATIAIQMFQGMLDSNFNKDLMDSFQNDFFYGIPKECN